MLRLKKPPASYLLVSAVVMYLVLFITFPLLVINKISSLRERIATLEISEKDLELKHQHDNDVQNHRMDTLEQAVFGTKPAQPVQIVSPSPAWLLNREKRVDERLRVLEEWRIKQEVGK